MADQREELHRIRQAQILLRNLEEKEGLVQWIRFASHLDELAVCINNWAVKKGFYDVDNRNQGELIALMHSELSEALEAIRIGNPPCEKIPEISSLEEEMADILIRVLDYCAFANIRIGFATAKKMEYNETRPHKHGKEF